MDYSQLFYILSLAVATVVIPVFLGKLYKKKLQVEIFQFECDLLFNHVWEDAEPKDRERVEKLYKAHKPSSIRLFFSKKPLSLNVWYYKDRRNYFFKAEEKRKCTPFINQ